MFAGHTSKIQQGLIAHNGIFFRMLSNCFCSNPQETTVKDESSLNPPKKLVMHYAFNFVGR